jgi:hypothetical protein
MSGADNDPTLRPRRGHRPDEGTGAQADVRGRGILRSVHAPTALVTGKEDDVEKTEYIPSLLPNATVHLLELR